MAAERSASVEKTYAHGRRLAIARLGVNTINLAAYGLMGHAGTHERLAYAILVVAYLYLFWGLWNAFLPPRAVSRVRWLNWVTTFGDAALILGFVYATGGIRGPFYPLLLLGLVDAAFRHEVRVVVVASAFYAGAYVGLAVWQDAAAGDLAALVVQVLYLPIAALFLGILGAEAESQTERKLQVQGLLAQARSAEKALQEQATQLEAQAVELRRSNEDLERFAYVASHDLQEPLRMVTSYVQLLERRYKDALDEEARVYIGYAADGAKRMKELINDLLEYSRVGRRDRPLVPIDPNVPLDDALRLLERDLKDTRGTVTRDPLPQVLGDRVELHLVFQNLLTNAVKFRGQEPPRIHVAAQSRDDHVEFQVTDNGIGLPRDALERVFVIFQRLHSRDKYPGTGIGLAIAKRIVERHGGQIWAESDGQGKGATFRFTLPKP